MQDYTKLLVWQKGHKLAVEIRMLCIRNPKRGFGDLSEQIRKSSSSVSANISEGCGAASNVEFLQFLRDARKSNLETGNHLRQARDTGYFDRRRASALLERNDEIGRMLSGLMRRVRGD